MGYEIKIYFGWLSDFHAEGEPKPFMEIASIDMAKAGYESQTHKLATSKDWNTVSAVPACLYGSRPDGCECDDARITEDLYGVKLMAVPIEHVRAALEADFEASCKEESGPYLRNRWACDLVRSLMNHDGYGAFVCTHAVFYGH